MSNLPVLPPIPEIKGDVDLLLDVYTHESLHHPGREMNGEYGSTDRLATLGASALFFAVTESLYFKRPFMTGPQMNNQGSISDTMIDMWLQAYKMKEKLRVAPGNTHVLNDPQEMRKYFHTFVGAIVIRSGLPTVQNWISALIEWSTLSVDFQGSEEQPSSADSTNAEQSLSLGASDDNVVHEGHNAPENPPPLNDQVANAIHDDNGIDGYRSD